MATLCLTMIVRDEEAMLGGCLASVAGIVDEVVVVDTGSRDGTMAIARAAGATVLEEPWQDDFSAPRNRAIAASRADWVLVLDADERLTDGARSALRRALDADDFDCGMLPLAHASRLDAAIEDVARGVDRIGDAVHLPRLFRRTPDLRYTGIVHENVGAWQTAAGRRTKLLPEVQVVHLGAVPDLRQRRAKGLRNVRLLERARELHPDDVTVYGYLAHEFLEAGERDKAREAADRGWTVLLESASVRESLDTRGAAPARSDTARLVEVPVLRLATARAWLDVGAGDLARARETLAVAGRLVREHPDLFFLSGCAAEMEALRADRADLRRDALGRALDGYERALGCAAGVYLQRFIEGSSGSVAEVRRATMLLLLGRADEALAAFDGALAAQGSDSTKEVAPTTSRREAQLGRIEALIAVGDLRRALAEVQGVLDDRPDGWTLAALAAEAAGGLDAMAQWIAKAQQVVDAGFVAPHRRERYHDALVALALQLGKPATAPGPLGTVARIVAGDAVPTDPPARGLEDPLVRGMVRRLVRHWLGKGLVTPVERLVEARAARVLPGIVELTTSVVDELSRPAR